MVVIKGNKEIVHNDQKKISTDHSGISIVYAVCTMYQCHSNEKHDVTSKLQISICLNTIKLNYNLCIGNFKLPITNGNKKKRQLK